MRKFLLWIVVTMVNLSGFGQSYDSMWKKVDEAYMDDLPKEVIEYTTSILKKAEKEGNFAQEMKAWVMLVNTKREQNPDSMVTIVPPKYKKAGANEAVVNALMGTGNQGDNDSFFNKVLENKESLCNTKADNYMLLMTEGKDSYLYADDMLSVLTDFVLQYSDFTTEQKMQLCQEVSDFYKGKGNMNAYTLMRLKMFEYEMAKDEIITRTEQRKRYARHLTQLLEESKDVEAGADVAKELFEYRKGDKTYSEENCLEFLRWAQKQFPKQRDYFVYQEKLLLRPSCSIKFEDKAFPNRPVRFSLQYRNMDKLDLEVRAYKEDQDGEIRKDGKLILTKHYKDFAASMVKGEVVNEGELSDSIILPPGDYLILVNGADDDAWAKQQLTTLAMTVVGTGNGKYSAVVTDSYSGLPIKGATVEMRQVGDNIVRTYVTDENGEADLFFGDGTRKRWELSAWVNDSDKTLSMYFYPTSSESKTENAEKITRNIYVDRPIYRPGQKVNVAVLSYSQIITRGTINDKITALENDTAELVVKDADNKEKVRQKLITNEFGSAAYEFDIPQDAKPGNWSLKFGDAVEYIRVEEYKRPTFFIECENESEDDNREQKAKSYSFGDTIPVVMRAQNYDGVPVQGAKVTYKIQTSTWVFWPYGKHLRNNWSNLAEGEMVTGDDGRVTVPVCVSPEADVKEDGFFVTYKVTCKVTNLAGETHEEQYTSSISTWAFRIRGDVPDNDIDLAGDYVVKFYALNADSKTVAAEEVLNPKWQLLTVDSVVVAEGTWKDGEDVTFPDVEAGTYELMSFATDKNGRKVTYSTTINLFNSEKQLATTKFAEDLFYVPENDVSENIPGVIYFSPKSDSTFVYIYLTANGKVIEKQRMMMGRKLYKLEFPYKKEYVSGFNIRLFYQKNGVMYNRQQTFQYVEPDNKLVLTWKTFRDKLTPGQSENWILEVKDNKGNKVENAEMFATMYDASLDGISRKLYWNLYTSFMRWIPSYRFSHMSGSAWGTQLWVQKDVKAVDFIRKFNEITTYFETNIWPIRGIRLQSDLLVGSARPMMAKAANVLDEVTVDAVEESATDEALQGRIAGGLDLAALSENENSPAKLRENFAETALFYPHLISNRNGEIEVSFTLPESLTEWRFLGLVHTKDMQRNTIAATAVARKEFMIKPNMPRFIREGDKATIVSSIVNQGDKDIEGNALLRIIDDKTDSVLIEQKLPFGVEAGKTVPVKFAVEGLVYSEEPLVCEISAQTKDFSDGERNYLVVLSSKEYLTETVPFFMSNEKEKVVDLSTLFNYNSKTATDKRLSLSYTDNPATLVVDALEEMKVAEDKSAPSYAASLYANIMLKKLLDSAKGSLPNCSVEPDTLDKYLAIAEKKLTELQNKDGSWSWFEGMDGNRYITLAVCENLAMLGDNLNSVGNEMLQRGLDYLDAKELEHYNKLKKQKNASFNPTETTLHYLYVYTLQPTREMNKELSRMTDKYLREFQKQSRNLSIYGKANGSNLLRYFGYEKKANTFLKSLMEYSTYKEGMGRYFDTRKALYSWRDYRIPTQLAAMRALAESSRVQGFKGSNWQELNEMMVWLLRQKQVQKWDNPMNTVDVADFLFKEYRTSITEEEKGVTTFLLDGKEIRPSDTIAVSQPVNKLYVEKLVPSRSEVVDENVGITWGAVTGLFSESVENIRSNSTEGLRITCKMVSENGGDSNTLSVGDKVRMVISVDADRDMDFVKVVCQHPACFEPLNQRSGYRWIGGSGCYLARHDSYTDLFFDTFQKGNHTLTLEFYVTREGTYQGGLSTVKCLYCPDFQAHSESQTIKVLDK